MHDSYWTHASTVEPMSERIRDMFISLHTQDLIGSLRAEFISRYGEYRIPIKSARAISASVATKRTKDMERRSKVAALLGEAIDSPIVTAAVEGENPDVETALSESVDAEEGEEDTTPKKRVTDKSTNLALSASDLATLQKARGEEVPQEQLDDQKFVRFKDILPPAPARGSFDVSRIKDSAYFFS